MFKFDIFPFLWTYARHSVCSKRNYVKLKFLRLKNFKESPISIKNFSLFSCLMKDDYNSRSEEKEYVFDDPYTTFTSRFYRHPGIFHNVLVIQPQDKSSTKREKLEDSERKLSEAVALVHTLREWRVVGKHIISTSSIASKLIFGSGNLEKIKHIIQNNVNISAIFIGLDITTAVQNASLEEYFGIPVFDRYQIILQIFHDHAHSKEAKLQLALAELPYLRVKMTNLSDAKDFFKFSGIHRVGGNETFLEKRRRLIQERETSIKKALEKVKNQRELLRNTERRNKYPIVAVVGYTNCGKTTLIKALTNDERLLPEDKLFATLDVTLHAGRLSSGQKVLFIDTVGFISNVPTGLIQAFKSTLEEINLSDIVVHVRDISNPDAENQKITVLKTLEELNLPQKLLNSILEVRNKADLLESTPTNDSEALYISATEGMGLPELQELIEEKLLQNTNSSVILYRVLNGGEEYRWLMKEGTIRDAIVDTEDQNFLIVEVILSAANAAKFKHRFGDKTISIEDIR